MIILSILTITVPVLLCVAFFTLAERQIMASMQRRFGPHVSGLGGILQPFWDGLKLGVKEPLLPSLSSYGAFSAAPMISFILSQISWCGIFISDASFQGLILMALSSLAVYGVMLAGWSSNSKYAFLGCLRSVALMVSYELSLGVALLSIGLFLTDCTGMKCLSFYEAPSSIQFALLPLCHIFLICILAETKRIPFDLPEAEAELVAGYNVEYSSLGFALFFIAEYANMAIMSSLASIYFLGGFSALKLTAIFFGFVWTRGTLPRYRYDQFMRLGWKAYLPLTLGIFAINASLDVFVLN
ncbi:NADH dehydrogenase subunit 1 (mitochondrion) [Chlamydomonas eustigma]|uniref:NADH-ubiquinone oxidoreductase chain 1 n=1 Tax=Chlamydomonas eustigma TaxID=1157962 RepID=A0A250XUQ8_9CHLO|nr:NADH dehydrogenase subunit 1 [Chlamydomonas eustigma]|eukprot:GAX86700.1 NADH dehydrogenase subunit 1 (mitochondrion) [Chlamydomonas eustigma]